mmetsp:Transcript_29928/g.29114  ORF Transcript_29928/g.29114 Transcript_29928/m.29114 type:complete len:89 (+) Transcript_29928:943-1209(+)
MNRQFKESPQKRQDMEEVAQDYQPQYQDQDQEQVREQEYEGEQTGEELVQITDEQLLYLLSNYQNLPPEQQEQLQLIVQQKRMEDMRF